jgi:hypothetical protein
MKTVYTTLPIYKALQDQTRERAHNNESVLTNSIYTPKHRLPSFQWIDNGDGATEVTAVYLVNYEGIEIDISTYFQTSLAASIPAYVSAAGDTYFIYFGTTLNYALPEGSYYLRIVMDTNHIYFSDWFIVDCVYCNFVKTFVNVDFDTFTIVDTTISSAIEGVGAANADSTPERSVYQGQDITVMFYLTNTGANLPTFSIVSTSLGVISNVETAAAGLNEITLTTTRACDDAFIRISPDGPANFSTSEILVYTQYACGFVTLSFSNCCNVGDILYEYDFIQTLWIHSDNIEPVFPYVEKGQENGAGKFIPTFRRQEKTYIIRTDIIPQYLVDVLNRLKLHDVMTYIDQIGDAYNVESVDVEYEWWESKYFATAAITIDLGESITAFGCC